MLWLTEYKVMLVKGFANFEGEKETYMRAFCDPNNRWNGWARPYIHCEDIAKCISLVAWKDADGDGHFFEMIGDKLKTWTIFQGEVEGEELIEPIEIEGEKYYWFGDEGLVFDFEQLPIDLILEIDSHHSFRTDVFYLSDKYGEEYQVTFKQGLVSDEVTIEKEGDLIDNESELGKYIINICKDQK